MCTIGIDLGSQRTGEVSDTASVLSGRKLVRLTKAKNSCSLQALADAVPCLCLCKPNRNESEFITERPSGLLCPCSEPSDVPTGGCVVCVLFLVVLIIFDATGPSSQPSKDSCDCTAHSRLPRIRLGY